MRLVTYTDPYRREDRVGLLHRDRVVDLNLARAAQLKHIGEEHYRRLASLEIPTTMMEFLQGGPRSISAAEEASRFALERLESGGSLTGPDGERMAFSEGEVRLRAPIPRPGKIVHTAGNFREHAEEGKRAGWEFEMPPWISFLKNPDAVVGPDEPIIYPKITKQLDHEIELAIVIGRRCKNIAPEQAYEYIVGYTVFNDITARDIQRQEMKHGLLNIGKNLDTFAPLGPCIATKDQIGDPHNLKMELRVNGEVRQSSNTDRLSVTIPAIVSHYSCLTLYPGDIVTTGTVSGVAAFRPDPEPYFLKPGDVIEAEIEKIGILRNRVIAEE